MRRRTITLTLREREDGGLQVISEDVPGLYLSGKDPEAVMSDVGPALYVILTHNKSGLFE